MNLNSDDYYSRTFILYLYSESDVERRRVAHSSTPKNYSNEPTFIKDDNQTDQTDQYIDDLKKGSSNILVSYNHHYPSRWQ